MEIAEFCQRCFERLETEIPATTFKPLIGRITMGEADGKWAIYAAGNFALKICAAQFYDKIRRMRDEIAPDSPPLELMLGAGPCRYVSPSERAFGQGPERLASASVSASAAPAARAGAGAAPSLVSGRPAPLSSEPARALADAGEAGREPAAAPAPAPEKKGVASPGPFPTPSIVSRPSEPGSASDPLYASTKLQRQYTFENFVEGESNRFPIACGKDICDNLASSPDARPMYNPLFVYGSTGLGKTHLVNAIGNRMFAMRPSMKIYYVHAEKYVKEFVNSARRGNYEPHDEKYNALNMIIVDDIQFLAGKEKSMEAFFYVYESLTQSGGQIVCTSDRPPQEIEQITDRLRTRFASGLTVGIKPPDENLRVDILMEKAKAAHVALPRDVAFYVSQYHRSNVRELEGDLNTLMARARFLRKPIDMAMAEAVFLQRYGRTSNPITVRMIQDVVSDYYEISRDDVVGNSRKSKIVKARHMAMCLAKDLTQLSLSNIAGEFGNRHHTSVMHAEKKIKNLIAADSAARKEYEVLKSAIQG